MANSIALFKQFVPLLDEVYKEASKTAVLDGRPELVQAGANANELVIPKMTMDGLADYSRNGGYVGGAMNLTNETVTCNFDRGRMFVVDHMDNADTAGVAFGMLAGGIYPHEGGAGTGRFPLCDLRGRGWGRFGQRYAERWSGGGGRTAGGHQRHGRG